MRSHLGYTVHDGLLNATGLMLLGNWLGLATGPAGGTFTRLDPGSSADL